MTSKIRIAYATMVALVISKRQISKCLISKSEISKREISKRLFGFQVSFFQVGLPSGTTPYFSTVLFDHGYGFEAPGGELLKLPALRKNNALTNK